MSSPTTTPYLEYPDVAARLGVNTRTVRRLCREEGLPSHQFSRRVRFLADEVDTWLRSREGVQLPANDHRGVIKALVDGAPELTAEQAERIRAVLGGVA
ncbi:helix-turn-helix domain-containing protein [Mycobacteroides chelonae]|uniref:helix-turn-helix domain-containing protein n=1 Tax=Mycobacteroides chelonae TaxID=1774 RepID=UPI0012FFC0EE|nr:helix-turn-helix domain-containing protein [Mycobacteroides chelonae]